MLGTTQDASAQSPMDGTPLIGANRHLAGVIPGSYPRAPQLANGNAPPRYDGTVSEFAANLDEAVAAQMWNRAKVCAACSKPCAVTLAKCNACFESLADVAVTATENIVMGFVYGVAHAAKFPLKISIRLEVADTLVYDDPLARSTAHLNAIPTDVHIPDWRWLLLNPSKAITLLNRLDQRAFEAVEATVYGNDGWRSEVLRPGAVASADELRPHCIAALNAVPSQYQIHLHYIVPPLLPNDNHCLLTGQRFSRGRWLPLSYVIAALKALQPMNGLKGATEMETADALSAIAALPNGPSYEEYFNAALESYKASHDLLENWTAHPERFKYMATVDPDAPGGYTITPLAESAELGEGGPLPEHKKLVKEDKNALSSYGASSSGSVESSASPASYYSHARAVGEVLGASDWVAA